MEPRFTSETEMGVSTEEDLKKAEAVLEAVVPEDEQQELPVEKIDIPGNINATLPHEILGVAQDASRDDIKRAYRKMMRVYHPDINKDPDATAISQKINDAYDLLLGKTKVKSEAPPQNPSSTTQETQAREQLLGQSSALGILQEQGVSATDLITIENVLTQLRELGPKLDPDTFDTSDDPVENINPKKSGWTFKEVGIMSLCFAIDLSQGGYGIQRLMDTWMRDKGFPALCEKIGVDPSKFIDMLDQSDACAFIFQMNKADKMVHLRSYTPAQLYELVRALPPSDRDELIAGHHDTMSNDKERLTDTDVYELIVKPLERAGGKYSDYINRYK